MTSIEFGFLLALGLMAWAAGYFAACAFWPFTWCVRCDGTGKRRSPTGKAFRLCKKCKGGGRKVRAGRRLWVWLSGKASDAA